MPLATTTVQGKILLPDGDPATAGTIQAILSSPASASDGVNDHRFGQTPVSGTIGGDGTVAGVVLVPNDVMTPSSTHYIVNISVTAPVVTNWTEKWSILDAVDPIDIGDIVRVA